MSWDDFPEEDDYDDHDDHGEDGGLDTFEPDHDDYDRYDDHDPYPEPRCLGAGCYDSGTDLRGRNCRLCNPTPWQERRAEWTWSAGAPWRWARRKTRAILRRPTRFSDEPPF